MSVLFLFMLEEDSKVYRAFLMMPPGASSTVALARIGEQPVAHN